MKICRIILRYSRDGHKVDNGLTAQTWISADGFLGLRTGGQAAASTQPHQSDRYTTQPIDRCERYLGSLAGRLRLCKDDQCIVHLAGFDGCQVEMQPSAAVLTASQGRGRDQGSYCIDRVSVSGCFCIMRIHDNERALKGHRGEVEFGYGRESAWQLTGTTIAWQWRTKAWVECASKTCTASPIQ
jgi:hypothetical protein